MIAPVRCGRSPPRTRGVYPMLSEGREGGMSGRSSIRKGTRVKRKVEGEEAKRRAGVLKK